MNLSSFKSIEFRAGIVSALILVFVLAVWHALTLPRLTQPAPAAAVSSEQAEYDKLMGKSAPVAGEAVKTTGFPTLSQMGATVVKQLANPSTTTARTTRASLFSSRIH